MRIFSCPPPRAPLTHSQRSADIRHVESLIPTTLAAHARPVPGAAAFLAALAAAAAPWAVVTSGTSALLAGWLRAMSLPAPPAQVVAEDVSQGKPDPECYVMGRARIARGRAAHGDGATAGGPGLEGADGRGGAEREAARGPRICVVEDAPSGVEAGKAAGCHVIAVATTHAVTSLRAAGADWVVQDLESVKMVGKVGGGGGGSASEGDAGGGGWEAEILNAWVQKT